MTSRDITFTRRSLLAGVVALATPAIAAANPSVLQHARISPEELGRALLTSLGPAVHIARDHARSLLANDPGQRGDLAGIVLDAAAAVGIPAERIPAADPNLLRRRLSESVRADFRDGRTMQVDGWVLSRTEYCLYRLAAFL